MGDVLNIYMLPDQRSIRYFERFTPQDLIVSNLTGEFNSFMSLDKDHTLGICSLCNA